MASTLNPDSLIAAIGWLLALLGAAIAARALLYDRPRGRRRCARCWYDMHGVPGLVCPECGRDAKAERRLRKTRRSRPLLALALFLITTGLLAPPVRRAIVHWPAQTPTAVLILASPWLEYQTTRMPATYPMQFGYNELSVRLSHGNSRNWEIRLLLAMCERGDAGRPFASEAWKEHYLMLANAAYMGMFARLHNGGAAPDTTLLSRSMSLLLRSHIRAFRVGDSEEVHINLSPRFETFELYIRPASDNDDSPWFSFCPATEGWCDRTIGPLQAGNRPFATFEVRIPLHSTELARKFGLPPEWQFDIRLDIAQLDAPVTVDIPELTLAIDDTLAPALSLAGIHELQLWLNIYRSGPRRRFIEPQLIAHPGVALAVQFEVLHDGIPVATGHAWWTAAHLGHASFPIPGTILRLRPLEGWQDAAALNADRSAWRLRITPDQQMAAHAAGTGATRYWTSPPLELPLRINRYEPPWERERP